MDPRKRLWIATASGAALSAIQILVGLAQFPVLLRHLPDDKAGIWLLFLTLGGYLALFDLGGGPTLLREMSFAALGGRPESEAKLLIERLLRTARAVYRRLALAIALLGGGAGLVVIQVLRPADAAELRSAWLLFVSGAALALESAWRYSALAGLGFVAQERVARAACLAFGFGALAASLALGGGLIGLGASWLVQGAALELVGAVMLRRARPGGPERDGAADWALARSLMPDSLRWSAMSLATLLILHTDNLIIALTLGVESIPSYDALGKICLGITSVGTMVAQSASAYLSGLRASGDKAGFEELLFVNARNAVVFCGVAVGLMAALGERIVGAWLGPSKFAGNAVLWVMLLMVFLETQHRVMAIPVLATGKVAFMGPAFAAAALNLIVSFALAGRMGLLGIAIGTLVAQLLTNNWYVIFVALRHLGLSPLRYLRRVWLPGSLALGGGFAVGCAVRTC